jgi:hypothetical protein
MYNQGENDYEDEEQLEAEEAATEESEFEGFSDGDFEEADE